MEDQLIIKVCGWRYYLRTLIISLVGLVAAFFIFYLISLFLNRILPLDVLLGATIIGLAFRMLIAYSDKDLFEITVTNGSLTGIGMNTRKEKTFPIKDMAKECLSHQPFWGKIEGYFVLRSNSGIQVKFIPYIYGKEQALKLYQILEQEMK
jgi:hypothetical protein